jgi:hypothetical protein
MVPGHVAAVLLEALSEKLDALREATANTPEMGAVIELEKRRDLTQPGHA